MIELVANTWCHRSAMRRSDDTYTVGSIMTHVAREKRVYTFPRYERTYVRACVRACATVGVEDIGELETSGTIPSRRRLIMGRQFLVLFEGYIIYALKLPPREIRVFQTRKSRGTGGRHPALRRERVKTTTRNTNFSPRVIDLALKAIRKIFLL